MRLIAEMQNERQDATETDLAQFLRRAGLRPTRQRLALGALLFGSEDRHVTAEMLHAEAVAAGERVSLATVYEVGLLRQVAVDGSKAYFDTNTSNHNHFLIESEGRLIDIPDASITIDRLPEPPEGMRISHVDVVIRLVPKTELDR